MKVRLLLNDPQNSYNLRCNRHLALPCFQRFQLPAILWLHGRNTCFRFEQHSCLLCVWLLEVLMACKRMLSCVSPLQRHFENMKK